MNKSVCILLGALGLSLLSQCEESSDANTVNEDTSAIIVSIPGQSRPIDAAFAIPVHSLQDAANQIETMVRLAKKRSSLIDLQIELRRSEDKQKKLLSQISRNRNLDSLNRSSILRIANDGSGPGKESVSKYKNDERYLEYSARYQGLYQRAKSGVEMDRESQVIINWLGEEMDRIITGRYEDFGKDKEITHSKVELSDVVKGQKISSHEVTFDVNLTKRYIVCVLDTQHNIHSTYTDDTGVVDAPSAGRFHPKILQFLLGVINDRKALDGKEYVQQFEDLKTIETDLRSKISAVNKNNRLLTNLVDSLKSVDDNSGKLRRLENEKKSLVEKRDAVESEANKIKLEIESLRRKVK